MLHCIGGSATNESVYLPSPPGGKLTDEENKKRNFELFQTDHTIQRYQYKQRGTVPVTHPQTVQTSTPESSKGAGAPYGPTGAPKGSPSSSPLHLRPTPRPPPPAKRVHENGSIPLLGLCSPFRPVRIPGGCFDCNWVLQEGKKGVGALHALCGIWNVTSSCSNAMLE